VIEEAAEAAITIAFVAGWRLFFAADKVARFNPVYRVTAGVVLDTLFGSAEDFESVPQTTRSP